MSTLRTDEMDWIAIEPGNRFFRVSAIWSLDALLYLLDQLPDHPEPTAGHLRALLAPGMARVGTDEDGTDEEEGQDPPALSSLVAEVRHRGPPAAKDALCELTRPLFRLPQPFRGEVISVLRRGLASLPDDIRMVADERVPMNPV